MGQDPVDDVLILNASDDFQRPATPATMSILKTRFRRCAQDIATCRSAGERTSVLAIRFTPLPRLAGVTSPRHRYLTAGRDRPSFALRR
jgi:hypothetical protein